jgi:hypothetical protein
MLADKRRLGEWAETSGIAGLTMAKAWCIREACIAELEGESSNL